MEPTSELGRYQVLGEIGRGSSGIVYHARDTLLGREVALKSVRPPAFPAPDGADGDGGGTGAEDVRGELLREARSAGMLSHPNVVTIYDVLEGSDGTLYIAMEYVEGRSLADVLAASGGSLDLERVVDLVSHIAAALDYLHAMGLVHRDVKPANILITHDGRVKLTDFGIAVPGGGAPLDPEREDGSGDSAAILGTPSYMAPEQILGRDITARTDVWSLGVVLYEMLCGRRPFDGRSVAEIVHRIVHGPVPDLSEGDTQPVRLRELLERALAKDPRWRYPSAGELARDLRKILYEAAGEAVGSLSEAQMLDRTVVSQRAFVARRRGPAWLRRAAAAVLLAAMLGFAAFGVSRWLASDRSTPGDGLAPEVGELDARSLEALRLLHQGRRLLAAGDTEGAAVFFEVVKRLEPELPQAERISRLRLKAERDAAADVRAAELEAARSALVDREDRALLASARRHLGQRDDAEAGATREALERARAGLSTREERAAADAPDVAPATARVTVQFSSDAPEGVVTIYGGGEQLLQRGFSYYEPRLLLGRRPSTGGFEQDLAVPPEVETLWVYVARPGSAAHRLEVPGRYRAGDSQVLEVHLPAEGEATAVLR